jgi:hypothetical protein
LEPRRIGDPVIGTGDEDLARFQGLAQGIEHLGLEFRQLVQEEDAVMGERGLAWPLWSDNKVFTLQ